MVGMVYKKPIRSPWDGQSPSPPWAPGLSRGRGGVNGQQGESIPPLLGRQAHYFFYFSPNLVGPGSLSFGGKWTAGGGGGGGRMHWALGFFADFRREDSNPGGGFF